MLAHAVSADSRVRSLDGALQFLVDKPALQRIFPRVFRSRPVIIPPLVFHTLSVIDHPRLIMLVLNFRRRNSFLILAHPVYKM
jgi:hypothetical protein